MPCNTFHLFPVLPTEIRLQIWSLAFPGSRVLEVVWSTRLQDTRESKQAQLRSFRQQRSQQIFFLENRSRLCLQESSGSQDNPAGPTVSYLNPKIDTLCIRAVSADSQVLNKEAIEVLAAIDAINSLRFLAVEMREWKNYKLAGNCKVGLLAHFLKLESLIVAEFDIDWIWIETGTGRPLAEIEFVGPLQMVVEEAETLRRLKDLPRSDPEATIPTCNGKRTPTRWREDDFGLSCFSALVQNVVDLGVSLVVMIRGSWNSLFAQPQVSCYIETEARRPCLEVLKFIC
jgi:hypothetical protein